MSGAIATLAILACLVAAIVWAGIAVMFARRRRPLLPAPDRATQRDCFTL
jgi:hypothetical protein